MTARGETRTEDGRPGAEGANCGVNLSGKRTLARRNSGECLRLEEAGHQRGRLYDMFIK